MNVNTAFSREAYTVSIIYHVGYMFYGNPSQREQKNLAIGYLFHALCSNTYFFCRLHKTDFRFAKILELVIDII